MPRFEPMTFGLLVEQLSKLSHPVSLIIQHNQETVIMQGGCLQFIWIGIADHKIFKQSFNTLY